MWSRNIKLDKRFVSPAFSTPFESERARDIVNAWFWHVLELSRDPDFQYFSVTEIALDYQEDAGDSSLL